MTPERANMILRGIAGSIDMWIEELQTLAKTCPEVMHLLNQMVQTRISLEQMIARDAPPT